MSNCDRSYYANALTDQKTVVVDPTGVVVVHSDRMQLGKNISELKDFGGLRSVIVDTRAGESSYAHLFQSGSSNREEWLVVYSGFKPSQSPQQDDAWTVLATIPLQKAMAPLNIVRKVLYVLNAFLIAALVVLAIISARKIE
ncbi:MAG: hypothetical protein ACFB16_14500 [Phormidesmis sp.]